MISHVRKDNTRFASAACGVRRGTEDHYVWSSFRNFLGSRVQHGDTLCPVCLNLCQLDVLASLEI